MDESFWRAIVADAYAVPTSSTAGQLLPPLLALLRSDDPVLREELAPEIVLAWAERGILTPQLDSVVEQLITNLTVTAEPNGVLLRATSVLVLGELMFLNNRAAFLPEVAVRQVLAHTLVYLQAETDTRAYASGQGWIQAIARTADLLWALAKNPALGVAELERLLDGIAARVLLPTDAPFLHDEDERLARAVLAALGRNVVTATFLSEWAERLAQPWQMLPNSSRSIETVAFNPLQTNARHNTKQFLRTLYLQLMFPGLGGLRHLDLPPPSVARLNQDLRGALQDVSVWT